MTRRSGQRARTDHDSGRRLRSRASPLLPAAAALVLAAPSAADDDGAALGLETGAYLMAQVDASQPRSFTIPAGDLQSALLAFSQQADLQLIYPADLTAGLRAEALEGAYAPEAALRRLLAGTGLLYRVDDGGTVTLFRAVAREQQGPKRLGPVTVTATRAPRPLSAIPGAVTVVDEEEVDKQRATTRDIQRILQQSVPGFLGPTGTRQSGTLSLRGRPALVLQNGVPQNQQLRNAGFDFNNIDPRQIERIEVVRGANATYGFGGTGGIINLITRRPDSDEPLFTLEVGTSFQTSNIQADEFAKETFASVEGRTGDIDYLLSGSFRDLETTFDAEGDAIPDQNAQSNSDVYDLALNTGWRIDPDKSLRLYANYFRDQDDDDKTGPANAVVGARKADAIPAAIATPAIPTGRLADPNESTNVQLTYDDADVLGSALNIQGFWQQWERHRFVDFSVFGEPLSLGDELSLDRRLGVRFNIDTPLKLGPAPEGTRVVWGTDFLNLFNSETVDSQVVDADVGSRPDVTQNSIADFAQIEVPIGDFLISTGVRHERFFVEFDNILKGDNTSFDSGDVDYDETLGNFGVVYYFTDSIELFGAWSQGFDVTQAGRAAAAVNSADLIELEPAVTDQFEIGARVFERKWDASLTGFYTDSDLASRTIVNPNGGLALPLRQPERIWGAEATVNVSPAEDWRLGGTFQYQDGLREVNGDSRRIQSTFIQPFRVTGFVEFDPFPWLQNRLQFLYSPGHDRFSDSTAFGEGEVSDLFLLDYFAAVDTDYGEFRLGIQNLLDEQYIRQIGEARNRASGYIAEPGRTVRLTYRVQF